jgi:hypothetical protein
LVGSRSSFNAGKAHTGSIQMRQLYVDCDGVLADFDRGATAIQA